MILKNLADILAVGSSTKHKHAELLLTIRNEWHSIPDYPYGSGFNLSA